MTDKTHTKVLTIQIDLRLFLFSIKAALNHQNLQFLSATLHIPCITDVPTWSIIKGESCKQTGGSGRAASCEWRLRWRSTVPCLPSATSPGAACAPAGGPACRAPGTQTCWAGPGPTGCRSTAAGGRSAPAGWERPESDGWCLGSAGYPERGKVNWLWEEIWRVIEGKTSGR